MCRQKMHLACLSCSQEKRERENEREARRHLLLPANRSFVFLPKSVATTPREDRLVTAEQTSMIYATCAQHKRARQGEVHDCVFSLCHAYGGLYWSVPSLDCDVEMERPSQRSVGNERAVLEERKKEEELEGEKEEARFFLPFFSPLMSFSVGSGQ